MISVANPLPRQSVRCNFFNSCLSGACNAPCGPSEHAAEEAVTGGVAAMEEHVHTGDTQGTTYLIKYLGEDRVAQSRIDSVLEAVDVEFNLWRPESRINAINDYAGGNELYTFIDAPVSGL